MASCMNILKKDKMPIPYHLENLIGNFEQKSDFSYRSESEAN